MERALIFSDGPVLRVEPPMPATPKPTVTNDRFVSLPRGLTLEEVERRYIDETLHDTAGRVGEAAGRLGITRKVLCPGARNTTVREKRRPANHFGDFLQTRARAYRKLRPATCRTSPILRSCPDTVGFVSISHHLGSVREGELPRRGG